MIKGLIERVRKLELATCVEDSFPMIVVRFVSPDTATARPLMGLRLLGDNSSGVELPILNESEDEFETRVSEKYPDVRVFIEALGNDEQES